MLPSGEFPWLLFVAAFVAGGMVKGALGVGLPLVAVPLLSLGLPVSHAIGMLVAPVLISNLLQAAEGGRLSASVARFRGLMLAQLVFTLLAVKMTLSLSPRQLNALVACSVLLAVGLMVLRPNLSIPPRREGWLGCLVGAASGVLGGISSLTGPVLITFLMGLGLERDRFVGSISTIYLAGSIPLYLAMLHYGRIGMPELGLSVVGLLPMAVGLALGRSLRRLLDERTFRRILLAFLCGLALILLFKK